MNGQIFFENGINLGLVLLLCGFFFKISAAPFHNWAPDVYDGTPTIITIWLTIIPKLSIFIFLLSFVNGLNISLHDRIMFDMKIVDLWPFLNGHYLNMIFFPDYEILKNNFNLNFVVDNFNVL